MILKVFIALSSSFALADEVDPSSGRQTGIGETVTIESLGSHWGFTFDPGGPFVEKGTMNMVPVTREAATLLQSLDKQSSHTCLILNSTFVPEKRERFIIGGTYFVLEISCD